MLERIIVNENTRLVTYVMEQCTLQRKLAWGAHEYMKGVSIRDGVVGA